ncbi:helix-turn-helix domain-containing protein [Herbidospora mongoliensis]|uniref:helix-turn-helix domain-containing protein n=1 Tax=Herbidospora mongoliensis TaxID=688067 RepID=UPI000AE634CD|nr:helix-turn-helix domain-containing protein [Herbidospora mongoliensis]
MPRPEKPIDPRSPIADFAIDLRASRRKAGLTYQQMVGTAHFSISVLSIAASGKNFPTWAVTEAYVGACGEKPQEWRKRWEIARESWRAAKGATA